ncbi:hypothetical protein EUX98_g6398 [Antrodiella citrinella]|uniref:Uncharacterized protein n=1 Tax=Antrodiella citrinella TaxID=2447956 RepID=A0A4S4MRS3_9APHY|nr:hypothetical protein EUX98_g6398 [Antrodiella citrinella]
MSTLFSEHFTFPVNPALLLGVTVLLLLAVQVSTWLFDTKGLHRVPGPFFAKWTSLWYGFAGHSGRVDQIILDLHKRYGKVVRIGPNQVSIQDADALRSIYGFSSKALKSGFYDALVQFNGTPSSFLTRSREDHTRKRKFVAHGLSMSSILEFQPTISQYQQQLVVHWDSMCAAAKLGKGGKIGSQFWTARNGQAWFDCMPWLNYVAFDIIGDLGFGKGFGMTASGTDIIQIATDQTAAIESFGSEKARLETEDVPLVKTVLARGEFSITAALMPVWARPILRLLEPEGHKALNTFGTIAATSIQTRLSTPTDRVDLLSRMIEGRDDGGKPMNARELCAESTTLLGAGSDTTSNSSCAMIYYLARDQKKQLALQKELDDVLGAPNASDSFEGHGGLYEKVKHLPYLEAVVNEGLRMYSTIGIGLPRVVPEGGLTVAGYTLTEGTVVGVPVYAVHHDASVWGPDVDTFNPERWLVEDKTTMLNAFAPFSVGPRACVGRNLAMMELTTIIATLVHRYHFVLEHPGKKVII